MENWLQELLIKWRSEGVKLNPPASVAEIENAETVLDFKFPEDFKAFYLQVNGFADFYMQEEQFTLWPITEIIKTFGFEDTEFIGFCDYLVNSHSIGYSKKFQGIFKDYAHVSDSIIAKTFKELIEIINSNPAIAY
jgi:hypothetical protein